jgi:hypothetical protein
MELVRRVGVESCEDTLAGVVVVLPISVCRLGAIAERTAGIWALKAGATRGVVAIAGELSEAKRCLAGRLKPSSRPGNEEAPAAERSANGFAVTN